jgi:IS6 family transposase
LLAERGLWVDHVTVWRSRPVLRPGVAAAFTPAPQADERYLARRRNLQIKGKWRYLYRAVDSSGATLDFLLSAKLDAAVSKALPEPKPWGGKTIPRRVSSTPIEHAAHPPAIALAQE